MIFLIDAMWFKSRPSLSGVALDLACVPHGLSLGLKVACGICLHLGATWHMCRPK
jgi:hypothetical protein